MKPPHIAQVAGIEALSELFSEPLGKLGQLPLSISRAGLSLLLMLHDQAADLPVAGHHGAVHALTHLAAGLLNDVGYPTDKRGQFIGHVALRRYG